MKSMKETKKMLVVVNEEETLLRSFTEEERNYDESGTDTQGKFESTEIEKRDYSELEE